MLRLSALAILVSCVIQAGEAAPPPVPLHERRQLASDLELRGSLKDGTAGSLRFVSRATLMALPHVSVEIKGDENFTELGGHSVHVDGVELAFVAQALGMNKVGGVVAVCDDGYSAPYPPEYLDQHHPVLAYSIEGVESSVWAAKNHLSDPGPYFMVFAEFVPAFTVLSHEDRSQVPAQVVRLDFTSPEEMFAGMIPAGLLTARSLDEPEETSPVAQGYQIARQNCYRCHNAGARGGTKAGRTWQTLGGIAKKRPGWFAAWVHDPQSIDPKSKMPGNPKYDRATLTALTRYFATFSSGE